MKQLILLIGVVSVMMLAACKEKKQTEDIITTKYEVPRIKAPISSSSVRDTAHVTWQGAQLVLSIERSPADSLPMVRDEIGQPYVDNRILLTIHRQDGTTVMQKVFTKNAFATYLDDNYRQYGILGSMVFDDVENGNLKFGVSINHPGIDDEFIPLILTIDAQGGVSILRDLEWDTHGIDDYEAENDANA